VPVFTADALVLRTYPFGEADRIVVFLTRDRGKKRGVAPNARRSRRRFGAALEPLTEARVAYVEREGRELVHLSYADVVRSPLGAVTSEALGHSAYFAELIDEWAAEADADDRLFRLGSSVLEALVAGAPPLPLARYFECWLLRLQGVYPTDLGLTPEAEAFVEATRRVTPAGVTGLPASASVLGELERKHKTVITMHLERELRSARVVRELRSSPGS
jgi:DNA repair protein RecO (recombination protein O)